MGKEKLKLLLGGALALALFAPVWAADVNYIESDEGNPELPASATPATGDLELPLLPIEDEPVEETVPEEIAPPADEEPAPEPIADETSAPVEEEAVVEIEAPADATVSLPEPGEEITAPVEIEAPAVIEEEPAVTAESSFNAEGQAQLKAAGSLLYSGDVEGAIAAYEALAATPGLDPDTYSGAVAGLASALRAAGRRDDAERRFEEALTFSPDNPNLRLAYGYTLAENQKLDRALHQFDLLGKATNNPSVVALAKARAYAWNGDYDNALQYYNNVTDPKLAEDAALGRAYVHYWMGDHTAARTMLATVERDDRDVRELQGLLGPDEPMHVAYHDADDDPSDGSLAVTQRSRTINEDSTYTGTTFALNIPLGPAGSRIFITHEDFDLDFDGATPATAAGTNTRVGFTAKVDDSSRITGYVGRVSIDNSAAQTIDHTDMGLRLAGQWSDDWTYHAAYEDILLYETPALAAVADGRSSMEFGVGFKVFDDDTTLNLLYASSEFGAASLTGYELDLRRTSIYDNRGELALGVRYQTMQNGGDPVAGYFAPDDYQLGELYLDWVDCSDGEWHLDAGVGIGMQSIDSGDWEATLRAAVGVRYDVSDDFILRAGVSQSNLPGVADDGSGEFSRSDWYVNGEWVF